jgi:hypothetical protein
VKPSGRTITAYDPESGVISLGEPFIPSINPSSQNTGTFSSTTATGGDFSPAIGLPQGITPIGLNNLVELPAESTSESIQSAIKRRISRQALLEFLLSRMNEDSIDDFRKLLEIRGDTFAVEGSEEAANYKRKRLFDMTLAVVAEEVLTPAQALEIIEDLGVAQAADLFEKMAVLEYGLFYLESESSEVTRGFSRYYVADNLVSLLHSSQSAKSYKDLTNVEEELSSVFQYTLDSLGISAPPSALISAIPGFGQESLRSKLLVRINGAQAPAEGQYLGKYKFFINYNTTSSYQDRDLLRKFRAIQPSGPGTVGYYVKGNVKHYLDGLSGYSYYGLLQGSHVQGYQDARNFLVSLWDNILERTIHY